MYPVPGRTGFKARLAAARQIGVHWELWGGSRTKVWQELLRQRVWIPKSLGQHELLCFVLAVARRVGGQFSRLLPANPEFHIVLLRNIGLLAGSSLHMPTTMYESLGLTNAELKSEPEPGVRLLNSRPGCATLALQPPGLCHENLL